MFQRKIFSINRFSQDVSHQHRHLVLTSWFVGIGLALRTSFTWVILWYHFNSSILPKSQIMNACSVLVIVVIFLRVFDTCSSINLVLELDIPRLVLDLTSKTFLVLWMLLLFLFCFFILIEIPLFLSLCLHGYQNMCVTAYLKWDFTKRDLCLFPFGF